MPQYNPVILVADVMQLLGAKGIETSVGVQATTAKHAAADLLRALGVALGVAPVSAPVAPRRPQAGEVGR